MWAAAGAVVLAVLFFNIFGLPFSGSDNRAGIVLPDDQPDGVGVDLPGYESNEDMLQSVTVDRSNIKRIIEALHRPDEYHIRANSTVYYSGGQSSVAAEEYVAGDVSRAYIYDDNGYVGRSCLIEGDTVYIWGSGSNAYYSGSKGSFSRDDYVYIPTYEKILEYDDEDIISADYSLYNEMYCLFVEISDPISGYRGLYYVSVENGLLIGAQNFEGGELVYSLSCDVLEPPQSYGSIFVRPDGTPVDMNE